MTAKPWIQGDTLQRVFNEPTALTVLTDYAGGNRPIYIGEAVPGTLVTAAAWRIQKRTYDGSGNLTKIEWCKGDAKSIYVWNSRASYGYS